MNRLSKLGCKLKFVHLQRPVNIEKQFGFSLIELMIASFLGTLLFISVTQVYLSANQTNRLQMAVVELQSFGNFALRYFTNDVKKSGWTNLKNNKDFNGVINLLRSTDGTGYNQSDRLSIHYQPDYDLDTSTQYDCAGRRRFQDEEIINDYFITDGALICNGQEIIPNVENLQILYGIDLADPRFDGLIDGYLRADQLSGKKLRIITIKLAIILSSENDVLEQSTERQYQVLDYVYSSPKDRKLRRKFERLIYLPNQLVFRD